MKHRWVIRASAVALAFGAALAGMGFDLGNLARAATAPSAVGVAVNPVVLSGIALQGPMVASAVTLYLVNPTNAASLAAIRTVPTDGLGNFTIGIQAQRYPMRLVARGGSFRSEMDGSTIANQSAVFVAAACESDEPERHIDQSDDDLHRRAGTCHAQRRRDNVDRGALKRDRENRIVLRAVY